MPLDKKTYRQIAKDILTQICGGKASEELTFTEDVQHYKLANTLITEITSIGGILKNTENKFVENVDYRLKNDTVVIKISLLPSVKKMLERDGTDGRR